MADAVRTVLFVCHANTCRSVMAHVMLERMLAERAAPGQVQVRSGGVGNIARDGMIPSLDARIVLREEGIVLGEETLTSTDLRRHRHLVGEADLILAIGTKLGPTDEARRAEFEALVASLKSEVARLNRLVGDFLSTGQPARLDPRPCDVLAVVRETAALVLDFARGVDGGR